MSQALCASGLSQYSGRGYGPKGLPGSPGGALEHCDSTFERFFTGVYDVFGTPFEFVVFPA